jgi:Tol biopolymer transport system component
MGIARLSRDGTRIAALSGAELKDLAGDQKIADYTLTVWDTGDLTNRREIKLKDRQIVGGLAWSRDGKRLYISTVTLDGLNAAIKQGKPLLGGEVAVIHVGTGANDSLTIPEDHFVLGEAADGRLVLGNFRGGAFLRSADGKKVERVDDTNGGQAEALSADGGKVLMKAWDKAANANRLSVLDLATAKSTPLTVGDMPARDTFVINPIWSPDGTKVLFLYQRIEPKPPQVPGPAGDWVNPRGHLCVADADGKNFKVIREDDDGQKLLFFDWR